MLLQKSLRNGVHHAKAVVWGPVYRTHLSAPYATDANVSAVLAISATPPREPAPAPVSLPRGLHSYSLGSDASAL